LYNYDVDAEDSDFNNTNSTENHTFNLIIAPVNMTINPSTGLITWTPANSQAAQFHNVSVKVTDTGGLIDTQNYTIFANNTNDVPVINSTPSFNATEETLYIYDVDANDDDLLNPSVIEFSVGFIIG